MRNWKIKANILPLYQKIMIVFSLSIAFLLFVCFCVCQIELHSVKRRQMLISSDGWKKKDLDVEWKEWKEQDSNRLIKIETSYFSRRFFYFPSLFHFCRGHLMLTVHVQCTSVAIFKQSNRLFLCLYVEWTYHGEHNKFKGIFGHCLLFHWYSLLLLSFASMRQMNDQVGIFARHCLGLRLCYTFFKLKHRKQRSLSVTKQITFISSLQRILSVPTPISSNYFVHR